jgi:hypothetical protein
MSQIRSRYCLVALSWGRTMHDRRIAKQKFRFYGTGLSLEKTGDCLDAESR